MAIFYELIRMSIIKNKYLCTKKYDMQTSVFNKEATLQFLIVHTYTHTHIHTHTHTQLLNISILPNVEVFL